MEIFVFVFESVIGRAAALRDAREGGLDGQVEEVCPVRVAAAPRGVEVVDFLLAQAAPGALVRARGV